MMAQKLRAAVATGEAAFWLTVAWLALDVLPGRLYRGLLPPAQSAREGTAPADLEPASLPQGLFVLRQAVAAIHRVSRITPLRCVCFHRAIAASFMLRRRHLPTRMHYGVARQAGGDLKAHVWVTSRGIPVVGLAESQDYTEIAHFLR